MPIKVFNLDELGGGEADTAVNPSTPIATDLNNNEWTSLITTMGEVLKNANRFIAYYIFNVDIPKGATIRRATVEKTNNVSFTNTLDLYRVALLDPFPSHSRPVATEDGVQSGLANWQIKDATLNTPVVWSDFEVVGEVYDDVPAATGDGPNGGASGGQHTFDTALGPKGTFGAAWTASSTYTLGEIRLRISRSAGGNVNDDTDGNTSRPGTDLFVEVYDVISATDRRPTGSPIATSDALSWDSLPIGSTPSADQNTWPTFNFTSGPTITSGTIHAYKLVEGAGNLLPVGTPFVRIAMNTTASSTTAAGIYWGGGGWTFTSYPHFNGFPNPSENAEGGPLVAGRCFGDDECIVPLGTFHSSDLGDQPLVWGHDLDAGGGIDIALDGTSPSTIDFVALIQKWIDDPGYDETGTRTAIVFDLLSGTDDLLTSWVSTEGPPADPGANPGMVLRVTFDDPVFAARAVEKRVATFVAEARLCQPDAESRGFTFPDVGRRKETFDPEDRTFRFPKDDRDEEFC